VGSTNTALGTVILATQYNPNDAAFASKIEMDNYEFASDCTSFRNVLHPVECKPGTVIAPILSVNQPLLPGAVVDQRLSNFGTFTIATTGMQAVNTVGELWVTYMIELLKPRISTLIAGSGGMSYFSNTSITPNTNIGSLGSFVSFQFMPATNGVTNPVYTGANVNQAGSVTGGSTTAGSQYVRIFNSLTGSGRTCGLALPYAVFNNRTVLIGVEYQGTTITSAPIITLGGGCVTYDPIDLSDATFTTTQSTAYDSIQILRGTNGALASDTGAYLTITSPAAASLSSVFVNLIVLQ